MMNPDDQISATLTARQWEFVMVSMRRIPAPFELSQPVIDALSKQLLAAVPEAQEATP